MEREMNCSKRGNPSCASYYFSSMCHWYLLWLYIVCWFTSMTKLLVKAVAWEYNMNNFFNDQVGGGGLLGVGATWLGHRPTSTLQPSVSTNGQYNLAAMCFVDISYGQRIRTKPSASGTGPLAWPPYSLASWVPKDWVIRIASATVSPSVYSKRRNPAPKLAAPVLGASVEAAAKATCGWFH